MNAQWLNSGGNLAPSCRTRHRQTDRQTDTDRQTHRQTDRQTDRQRDTQTQTDRQANTKTDRQKHPGSHTNSNSDSHAVRDHLPRIDIRWESYDQHKVLTMMQSGLLTRLIGQRNPLGMVVCIGSDEVAVDDDEDDDDDDD